MPPPDATDIERVFREEYGRAVAVLVRRFGDIHLAEEAVQATRKTRGDDIDAACGQLAGQVQDKTRRTAGRVIPLVETRS